VPEPQGSGFLQLGTFMTLKINRGWKEKSLVKRYFVDKSYDKPSTKNRRLILK